MKLLVIIASRANPAGIISTICSLMGMASGKHEIKIKIGADNDDTNSFAMVEAHIKAIYPSFEIIYSDRKPTLGAVLNSLALGEEADIYLPLTDRMVVMTPNWDDIVANASMHFFDRMLWWTMQEGIIMPIITKKWYQALGGIFTEYFPFWFDDTWLSEVSAFVHANAGYALPVALWRKPGSKTKRCHDMRFWMDFFIKKRPERVIQGRAIAEKLYVPVMQPDILMEVVKAMQMRDKMWEANCDKMQKEFGDPSVERDASYMEAFNAAQ